jgi:hypothetical protein
MNNGITILNLYNGIYKLFSGDTTLLNHLGLTGTPTPNQIGPKLQKQSKPQQLSSNIPLIAFYTPGGGIDSMNMGVFCPMFYFDIYTNDNVKLAHQIAERVCELISGCINFTGVAGSSAIIVDAHESDSKLDNVYCFTIEATFSNAEV